MIDGMPRSLNISTRILILVFVLLNLMITGFSFGVSLLERLGGEVQLIANKDIPLIQTVTEATDAQWDGSVQFQRAMRFGKFMSLNDEAKGAFALAQIRFAELSERVDRRLKTAAQTMGSLIKALDRNEDAADFHGSLKTMDEIRRMKAAYAVHAEKVFYAMTRGEITGIEALAAGVEAEQDALNAKLKYFLGDLERFTALSAIRVRDKRLAFSNFMAALSIANVIVSLALAYFISRSIIRPIKAAVVIADKITAGIQNIQFEVETHDEIGQLLETMNRMLTALQSAHAAVLAANTALEGKVRERTHELELKNRLLDRSNRDLGAFAGVIAHDLKAPLFNVQLMTDTLRTLDTVQLDEKPRALLDKLKNSVDRMQKLIDALLSYSVVTHSGGGFKTMDLKVPVEGALADLEAQIREKGASVSVGDLIVMECDPVLMRQLIQNLVANALKYQSPGNVPRIEICAEKVTLEPSAGETHPSMDLCLLHVTDNGIGFDEKNLKKIFLPFERIDKEDRYGGFGIGLATCMKIAEHHHGGITAKSSPGKGSTFTVTLPVSQAPFRAIATAA